MKPAVIPPAGRGVGKSPNTGRSAGAETSSHRLPKASSQTSGESASQLLNSWSPGTSHTSVSSSRCTLTRRPLSAPRSGAGTLSSAATGGFGAGLRAPPPLAPPAPLWLPPPASTRGAAGEGRAEAAVQGRARPLSDTVSPLCPPQVPPTGWVNALHGAAAGRWHGGHPRAGPSFPVRGRVPEDKRALRAQNS